MKMIILTLLILQFNTIIGQNITSENIQKEKLDKFEITNLEISKNDFSFRFWNKGQLIEIHKDSDSIPTGILMNFVTESSDSYETQVKIKNKGIIPYVYFQKINLTQKESEKILKIILDSKITESNELDSIDKWKLIADGEWFSIEQKINGKYVEKHFENPKSQEDLAEVKIFLNFYYALEKNLNLDNIFWEFFGELNVGCFTRNGEHEIICKEKKNE